jgi:hypothetical protein
MMSEPKRDRELMRAGRMGLEVEAFAIQCIQAASHELLPGCVFLERLQVGWMDHEGLVSPKDRAYLQSGNRGDL